MKHLLGFYCDSKVSHSIYSSSSTFLDRRYGELKSIIKPLRFIKTNSHWFKVPQTYSTHPVLDYIVNHQLMFHTSNNDDDFENMIDGYQCGMLMHVPVGDEQMGRTGVFVIRNNGEWQPLTIQFRDQLYLLECKGVGSGIESYKDIHYRTQAGSLNQHVRITGGMMLQSAEREIENLMRFQMFYDFNHVGIFPYGCIGFNLDMPDERAIQLGLLLRLAPSNIRLSYDRFGDFSHSLDFGQTLTAFSDINTQLYRSGVQHENVNANNLCFCYPSSYVITDFEEVTSIYSVPTSLDVIPSDEPLYLKVYPFRYHYSKFYPETLKATFMEPDLVKAQIGSNFESSKGILSDYYSASRIFLLDDYFKMPLKDWVSTTLTLYLSNQLDVLQQFLDVCVQDCIDPDKDLSNQFIQFINDEFNKNIPLMTIRMDDYFSIYRINNFLLRPKLVTISELKKRIKHGEFLLRQVTVLLETNDWFDVPSAYEFSFLKPELILDYYDVYLLMFPYLQWVTHWRYFLALNYKHDNGVSLLIKRLDNDRRYPKQLYDIFSQQSSQDFLQYLTQL